MTPLERLLAEELPTGRFGDAEPAGPAPQREARAPGVPPPADPDAAAHRAALLAALAEKPLRAGKARHPAPRHLHALPPAA